MSEALRLTVDGAEPLTFDIEPEVQSGHPADATTGQALEVRWLPPRRGDAERGIGRAEVTVDGWVLRVAYTSARRAELLARAGQDAGRRWAAGAEVVRARIPGRVVRVWVADGDTVEMGARLLAIEAMKMENEVRSPRAGMVSDLRVAAGQGVELGDELLTVA